MQRTDHDLDMFPTIPMNNIKDIFFRYMINFSELRKRFPFFSIKSSNFYNLIRSKFVLRSIFTSIYSSFTRTIQKIISLATQYQMGRIYTRRIITFVHNYFPFWNFTLNQLIRKPMNMIATKLTITSRSFTTNPYPTAIRNLFNFFPKSFRSFIHPPFMLTFTSTKNMWQFSVSRRFFKILFTRITNKNHYFNNIIFISNSQLGGKSYA